MGGADVCGSVHDCDACCADEPWRLWPENCCGIQAGGWLNGGIMLNMHNNSQSRNDPVAFSNPAGEVQGNQAWGYLVKETNTGGYGWDFGARVDYVFGTDGPDTQAFGGGGWDQGWNSGGEYGSAIPQIYAEVAYNDVKVKLGHFFTIMGYEVVPAPGNFFYSHAYTMNFGEPFTHTGALAEWAYDEYTTLWGGYVTGWDNGFDNFSDSHTYLGGIQRQVSDRTTVTYTVNAGRYGNGIGPSGNLGDIFAHSLVIDVQLSDRTNYVLLHDLAHNEVAGAANNAEWYGVTQYLFYTINECWKAGFRFEWFDDADGLRISSVNDGLNDLHFFAATFGLNWRPTANFTVRPEARFDWATSHSDGDFNDIYIRNTSSNIQTVAIDAIWTF